MMLSFSSPTVTMRVFSTLCFTLEDIFSESNFNSFVILKFGICCSNVDWSKICFAMPMSMKFGR